MTDLDALRAAVAAGDLESCVPLCDVLEECGQAALARRLRSRVRRWQKARRLHAATAAAWVARQRWELAQLQRQIEANGGKVTWSLEATVDTTLAKHEDALLVAFVARLLAEIG